MKWFAMKGHENRYVISEDGKKVRSLPKDLKFGSSVRHMAGKVLKPRASDGTFQLSAGDNCHRFYVKPEELPSLMGEEVSI